MDDSDNDSVWDEEDWIVHLAYVRRNNVHATSLYGKGEFDCIQEMTNEDWEQLGRDLSNSRLLDDFSLDDGALNDHSMSFFFRGLTRSSSIKEFSLCNNHFGIAGVRSMVPFLKNATNLKDLALNDNNIQSEGFNMMFRALRDSPIERLQCGRCGIEYIEIDTNHIPRSLTRLHLSRNKISIDGCLEVAKLLQGRDAALKILDLDHNQIDDDGVEIMVNTLQQNKSLLWLDLRGNGGISDKGLLMLLKLVGDVSSIKATLQSNQTLVNIFVKQYDYHPRVPLDTSATIQQLIHMVTAVNASDIKDSVGGRKVTRMQLHSETRSKLAEIQGVNHSVYNEIDPLHLPEVLSSIGERHGHNELFTALSSSIMTLFSTMSRKKCIKQEMEYHAMKASEHAAIVAKHTAKLEALSSELGAIEATEGPTDNDDDIEHRSNKRRRNENK